MRMHVSIETAVLTGVTALALVLCSLTGLPEVAATTRSASPLDPTADIREDVERLMALFGEHKPWRTLEGQFSEPSDCSKAVLRDLLEAPDEQWQQIKPRFQELEAIRRRTHSTVRAFMVSGIFHSAAFGSGSSGPPTNQQGGQNDPRRTRRSHSSTRARTRRAAPPQPNVPSSEQPQPMSGWWRPSQHGKQGRLTEGERLCEELLDMVEDKTASPETIRAKMAQLTAYRQQAKTEMQAAQEALRQVVTRRQEAMLILMGHLDR
jgi:hypothetical protein